MAFSFGRGKKASKSTAPYMGGELGFSSTQMHQGAVVGRSYNAAQTYGQPKGMARLPMEHTAARQYADSPISSRATTSFANYDQVLAARSGGSAAASTGGRRRGLGIKMKGVGSTLGPNAFDSMPAGRPGGDRALLGSGRSRAVGGRRKKGSSKQESN